MIHEGPYKEIKKYPISKMINKAANVTNSLKFIVKNNFMFFITTLNSQVFKL